MCEWEISSLKLGMFAYEIDGSRHWSLLSPLYGVRITEDDELMKYSDKLKGKDGVKICKKLCDKVYKAYDEFRTTKWLDEIFGV